MTDILPTILPRAGGVIHYIVSGRNHAPALVLLHPLAASLASWDLQLAEFERFFRVIRLDLRGHGLSKFDDGPAQSCSLQDLALDALAVLDALHIERAHWCGLSMGGLAALQVALMAPRRVLRLVVAHTAASVLPFATDRVLADRESPVREIAVRDAELAGRLGEVQAPTLVIAGAHDPVIPIERAEELADGIAGADLVVLDAAHRSHLEQAEDFTRTVVDFLRD
ncbi:MAG: alpha/beta fold hydrolase [Gammaproteobacteria bacterium]|nr:alpha/beta fold hydrolase [Gammaproteobacteria bacterium]